MRGVSLHKTVTVAVNWTAEDWDLYTDMKGVGEIAASLNRTLTDAVNRGESRESVVALMDREMRSFREFGANDTEPVYNLYRLLDFIYEN